MRRGEILGVGGVEGNGQTELINLLIGMFRLSGGSILLDGEDVTRLPIRQRRAKGVGYISEDRMTTGLALQANADENLICGVAGSRPSAGAGSCAAGRSRKTRRRWSASSTSAALRRTSPSGSLSGGNMQKIVLAREISPEPQAADRGAATRGLDIGAINFVREHLLEQKRRGTAILLVSADLEELMSLSDRMIILYEGRCSGEVTDIPSATEAEIGLMMGGITSSEREAN